ncbi:Pisatin demethylase-like protein [Apiospora arundinis]
MPALLTTVVGGLVAVCAFVVLSRIYLSPIRHIPGPGFAAVTRFWYVRRLLKGKINLDILAAHDRYGHFVRIAPNEVSVGHPDGPRKILLATLHKAEWYKIATFPDARFYNTFAETNPKAKMELTKRIAPGYTMSNLLQSEQAIDSNLALLLDWLDRFAESGDSILLGDYLRYTTNDIVGDVLFSRPFGFLKKGADIGGTLANAEVQIAYVSVMGFFRWAHVLLLANPVMTWLNMPFEDRQKNPDGRYDVSAHWFRTLAESEKNNSNKTPSPGGRPMQRHEIDSAAFNAISAATDTVAATIQAFMFYLMRHPEFRARALAELADAGLLGADGTESCLGFPRLAPKGGITIGDQTFPEGTTLSVHPWVIHLSLEIWGEDAREFNPDRWLGEDAARLEKHFIPFSLGYGSCPGQNLGRIELSKICATLLRNYDFSQVDPNQQMKYEAYFGLTAHIPPCYVKKQNLGL